ncbi:MAG: 50S ribosomal protein L18 [Candidatus Aminicenantes bacterium]|nr:50S ribosomal protein L18 [Candidatus Aminicenantes bacterium]MBL7082107.1 50S ribosomal protein L18 [Candidatus Aminicenantes bacterium]
MYKNNVLLKKIAKDRIRKRIKKKIRGTSKNPRVFVFKSNRYVFVQVIDDENSRILASTSTLEKEFKEKNKNYKNIEACQILGGILAKKLKQIKIEKVVFDRGLYPYHGRIKALAEAMRKGGLIF